ncbi:MAG: SPL family radical SAM protein [Candidatus Asgardarchaeia archaeon]
MLKVAEIFPKTIISKSGIYSIDYSINPYLGCQHGCVYCYAKFMRKYANTQEKWGSFVFVKRNAQTLVKKELKRIPLGSSILLSSVCDPYQKIEEEYEITRGILEILKTRKDLKIYILTKSNLVIRDVDVIKEMQNIEVGFSIAHFDEKVREIFEPNAPSIEKRISALKILAKENIKTYLFVAPILPFITDSRIKDFLKLAEEAKVSYIFFDKLNIKAGNWRTLKTALDKFDEKLRFEYEKILFTKSQYFENLKSEIQNLCKQYNKECTFGF